MKTKSKLVLGLSILSAATLAAGATSTFAWYQVTATGSVKSSEGNIVIVTSEPTGSVTTQLPLKVTVSSSATLELAHWYAAGDLSAGNWRKGTPASYAVQNAANTAGLYTAFHLNNTEHTLIHNDAPIGDGRALWADVTVTITQPGSNYVVDGTSYTPGEIATLLNGKKVDVALAGASGSRAMFYYIGTAAAAAPTGAGSASMSDTSSGFTLANLDNAGTVLHIGMYIEGDNSGTVDSLTVNGNFNVTISQH